MRSRDSRVPPARCDVYYNTPDGKVLRSLPDVRKWLDANEGWAPPRPATSSAPLSAAGLLSSNIGPGLVRAPIGCT